MCSPMCVPPLQLQCTLQADVASFSVIICAPAESARILLGAGFTCVLGLGYLADVLVYK